MAADHQYLCVVGSHDQHVTGDERPGAVLVGRPRPDQCGDLGDDAFGFLGAVGGVAVVCDEDFVHPGFASVEAPRRGDLFDRGQPASVGKPRHRPAHGWVHPPRSRQETPQRRVEGGRAVDQPAQRRLLDRFGVCALADLGLWLGIAEEQEVAGSRGDGDGVGEAELAGFLDDQQLQAAGRHPAGIGKSHAVPPITQPPPSAMKAG